MTDKIFWDAPYLTRLDTAVASVDGDDVTVEQTIFYALSGGQESDYGSIGGRQVMHARKDGSGIVYTLAPNHGLRPGDHVTMQIDWARRYRLMRLHFAAEIVLELVYRKSSGIEKIGAHIAPDKARIDFAWDENIAGLFPQLTDELARIVAKRRAIGSGSSDRQARRRYWEIDGFGRVPCGGTHLRNTAEIGAVKLKRRNTGKGKERIEIYLDELAPAEEMRNATVGDVAAMQAFLPDHGANQWNWLPADLVAAHLAAIGDGGTQALLVKNGAQLLGFVTYVATTAFSRHQPIGRSGCVHGNICEAVVHRDHAGRGIGARLVREAIAQLTAQGMREIYIERHEENLASAGMMRKAGFVEVDVFDDPQRRTSGSRRTSVSKFTSLE